MAKAKKKTAERKPTADDRKLADKRADEADEAAKRLAIANGQPKVAADCESPYSTDAELLAGCRPDRFRRAR